MTLVSRATPGGDAVFPREPPTARTNGAGEFAFASVEPGTWTVRVDHAARALAHLAELAVAAPDARAEIELPSASIEGVVVGSDGRPLAGAEVRVARDTGAPSSGATIVGTPVRSDPSGRFTLRGVPADVAVVLLASAERHAERRSAPLTLARGEVRGGVELVLRAACDLDVRVVASSGAPARGCSVTLRPPSERSTTPETRATDQDGVARFRGLDAGRWSARVDGCGVDPARASEHEVWVELVAGELASATITLP
jgi:hypothetical protein